ncbi:MAG: cephalosporin hydroxylase family protein [Cyanobacteria bacterium]|nr:cephalosporin hydroxylase family protein [Cyanobacteriota bacterium]
MKKQQIDPVALFNSEKQKNIEAMADDQELRDLTRAWFRRSFSHKYSYNFSWMGRPIIQYPQDLLAMQEIIWQIKPQLIIETGIAHGGSIIYYASLLELIGGEGLVVGIDIDIRAHNRVEIEKHPMSKRIHLLEGSSLSDEIVDKAKEYAQGKSPILVILDSNHTHEHVYKELELYSPLVTEGSYLVVFDTVVEDMTDDFFPDRPWGVGNNPGTAVREFLTKNDRFVVDVEMDKKLVISVAPAGYLKCIKP